MNIIKPKQFKYKKIFIYLHTLIESIHLCLMSLFVFWPKERRTGLEQHEGWVKRFFVTVITSMPSKKKLSNESC